MVCRIVLGYFLMLVVAMPAVAQQRKRRPAVGGDVLNLYEARTYKGVPYRLMKPIERSENPQKNYPLVLSLHGAGGRGSDNIQNLRNWNAYMADETLRRKHPCFVVAPQSAGPWRVPRERPQLTAEQIDKLPPAWKKVLERRAARGASPTGGNLDKVFGLLDALAEEFSIDTDRVYVLGHSMGGFGTWTTLGEAPDRFAAAIPTAGGLNPVYDVTTFAHVPIWTFHGAKDTVVPTELTREAFGRLKAVEANVKYTELAGVGHGANAVAFRYRGDDQPKGYVTQFGSDQCDKTPDVWEWLFAQRRKR